MYIGEGVDSFPIQLCRSGAFELLAYSLDRQTEAPDHEMDVIRHDRTRVYRNHATADVINEPNGNRSGLSSVKYHRPARKRRSHSNTLSGVESTAGN